MHRKSDFLDYMVGILEGGGGKQKEKKEQSRDPFQDAAQQPAYIRTGHGAVSL